MYTLVYELPPAAPAAPSSYPDAVLHTPASVLERVVNEFNALEAAIAGLEAQHWEHRLGKREGKDPWTVKDSLAHVTHWKTQSIRGLRGQRRKPGEAPPRRGVNEENHAVYEEWKERSLADVLAWHRAVQDDLVVAVKEAPDTQFFRRERSPVWPFDAVGHSTEHRVKDFERPFAKGAR